MILISDATLMAYADGELDEARADAVRKALVNDPVLRGRLEKFQSIDDQVRAAFAPDLDVPERFTDLLRDAPPSHVVQLDRHRKPVIIRAWIPAGSAIAAGVAGLVAGGILTSGTTASPDLGGEAIIITGEIQAVVAQAPSGKSVMAAGSSVTPILSFVTAGDVHCREIHIANSEMAARAVACKDKGHNEWRIEAFARMPVSGAGAGYHTAGQHKDAVIEAAFARLSVKYVLDAGQESLAIAEGWPKK